MNATIARKQEGVRTPVHLWIIGVLALLWNGFGAFDYAMTMFRVEAYMSQFTPEQLDYFYSFPTWAVAAWATGVWSAVGGSLALLLRSRFAVHLFGLSLLGLVVTTIYTNVITDSTAVMGDDLMVYVIFSVIIWIVLIGLLWYSIAMSRTGVLR
jgi:hypothetical protein